VKEAYTKITGNSIADKSQEPFVNRQVQSHIMSQRCFLFGRGDRVIKHNIHRITGCQRNHGENNDTDPQHDRN